MTKVSNLLPSSGGLLIYGHDSISHAVRYFSITANNLINVQRTDSPLKKARLLFLGTDMEGMKGSHMTPKHVRCKLDVLAPVIRVGVASVTKPPHHLQICPFETPIVPHFNSALATTTQ